MFAGAISVNSVVLCLLIQLLNHPTTMGHNFVLLAAQGRVAGLRGAGRWLQVLPSFRAVIYFLEIDANSLNGVCGEGGGFPGETGYSGCTWAQEACGMLNGLECFRMVDRITRSNSIRNTLCCCFYYLCLLARSVAWSFVFVFVLMLLFLWGIAVVGSGICRWFSMGGSWFSWNGGWAA